MTQRPRPAAATPSLQALREKVRRDPEAVEPRLALGRALVKAGQHGEAIELLRQAVAAAPESAEACRDLGLACHATGRFEEAERAFIELCRLEPENADAANNLGVAQFLRGRADDAEASFRRAVALKPDYADALNNLGLARKKAGAGAEAEGFFRQALAAEPDHVDALGNLGVTLSTLGKNDEAIDALRRAVAGAPKALEHLNNLAMALSNANRDAEAIPLLERAIALKPDYAEAMSNLGAALRKEGQTTAAIAILERALALRPGYPAALANLGLSQREAGLFDQAEASYRQAIAGDPGLVTAHWNLSLLQLLRGDWRAGWPAYEWRFKRERGDRPRRYTQRRFNLDVPAGSTVLVHAEQGFGDTIQFARYVPLLKARGHKVIFEVQPALQRLLHGIPGVTTLGKGARLPAFDSYIPLLSLPGIFQTTVEAVPAGKRAYLRVSENARERWRAALRGDDSRLAVGLAWRGNPKHQNDRNRSLGASQLGPLLGLAGVRFVSLQKDARADEIELLRRHGEVLDPAGGFKDFADTAEAVSALDLVISIDSAVAHLAGALGLPVWILLPHVPDWRWLLDRADSPWYGSARLFRQPGPRDWPGLLANVRSSLETLALKDRVAPVSPRESKG